MKTPMQILISEIEDGLRQDEIKVSAKELLRNLSLRCTGLLEKEKEAMVDFAYKCRNLMAGDEFAISKWYDKTFDFIEPCKCGKTKIGGYNCLRTDCNQNL